MIHHFIKIEKVNIMIGFSNFTFSGNSAKTSPKIEENPIVEENTEEQPNNEEIGEKAQNNTTATAFFSSAWTRMGDLTKSASQNISAGIFTKKIHLLYHKID